MKRTISLTAALFALCALTMTGCSEGQSSADAKAQQATEQSMAEAYKETGMPAIRNWTEKKTMKWIYELRDEASFSTYAYIADMNGRLHYIGEAVGYGLPASVQYSNPDKVVGNNMHALATVALPEPNGLFMPEGLSATWLIMLDAKGEPKPVYIESEITVSPFPLPYAVYPDGVYDQLVNESN